MRDVRSAKTLLFAIAVASFAIDAGVSHAVAQDTEDKPVKERSRPEFDPVGIRTGNIFFYPAISVSEAYNDNVFASESNETSDFITVASPSLSIKSDGTRGGWQGELSGRFGFYADESDENYSDMSASLGGHYNVAPTGTLSVDAGFARLHEDRSSPDDVNGTEPTVFNRADARARYNHRFNRLAARFGLRAADYSYEDVDTATGTIDNSGRDRFEIEESLRLSYDFLPDYSVFTQGTLSQRRYDDKFDRNGIARDSDGYRVDAGVTANLTGLLTLEVSAGYLSRDYEAATLPTVDGVAARASAIWNVTRLTTVTATLDREVEETTINGAAGRLDTVGRLEIDHELRRNIIVSGQVGYGNSDFQGISREDDRIDVGISAQYLIDQGLSLSASATHVERESDAAGADFARNVYMVRLRYGF